MSRVLITMFRRTFLHLSICHIKSWYRKTPTLTIKVHVAYNRKFCHKKSAYIMQLHVPTQYDLNLKKHLRNMISILIYDRIVEWT